MTTRHLRPLVGGSGFSARVPTGMAAAVVVPRRTPEPEALGSERQIDAAEDGYVRNLVLEALSFRVERTVADIEARVPTRYRWRVVEALGELRALGKASVRRTRHEHGGRLAARWRRR